MGCCSSTEKDTVAASEGPSVSPNLFHQTELWTESRMNPSTGEKQRCLMKSERSKPSEMNDKVKLLPRPQLAHQQPFSPIFFWPQRLIACSAELGPVLPLTPCAEPSHPLHLTNSVHHHTVCNSALKELGGENFCFRKQDTVNSFFYSLSGF